MYKSILVHVDDSRACKTRLATAVALAKKFSSSLTGVFLKSELVLNYLMAEGMVVTSENVEAYIAERNAGTDKAMSAARHAFDDAVRDVGVPFYWLAINGDDPEELIGLARRHDLTILPPEMKPVLGQQTVTAAEVGMGSGGPVLVLKPGAAPAAPGSKVLVAWKDSRESTRALRDAWPFLSQADEITFLTVSRNGKPELDEELQRQLHVHGCKAAKLVVERNDEITVGDLIRRHAGIAGADLVVLGLYGHSRLREMVLGGVSRDLLHDLPTPLLVSH